MGHAFVRAALPSTPSCYYGHSVDMIVDAARTSACATSVYWKFTFLTKSSSQEKPPASTPLACTLAAFACAAATPRKAVGAPPKSVETPLAWKGRQDITGNRKAGSSRRDGTVQDSDLPDRGIHRVPKNTKQNVMAGWIKRDGQVLGARKIHERILVRPRVRHSWKSEARVEAPTLIPPLPLKVYDPGSR